VKTARFGKYSFVVFLVLLGLIFSSIGACTGSTEPTPAPAPTPTPTPTPPTEPITITFSSFGPSESADHQAFINWAKVVEEKSENRVKFDFYWNGTLLPVPETFRGVQEGVADMSDYVVGIDMGLLPLNEFARLPFLEWPSVEEGGPAYQEVLDKMPELMAEYKGLKPYAISMMPPYQLSTVKKVVRVPEDVKGMKIIAQTEMGEVMNLAGAAPVDIVLPEWFTSLERGVAEGVVTHLAVQYSTGMIPLFSNHTIFGENGIGCVPALKLINIDTWNKLPADIQKIFEETESLLLETLREADNFNVDGAIKQAQELDQTITYLTPEEIAVWTDLCKQPVEDEWIEQNGGADARALLEEAKSIIKEYGK
jgi:TRAP-type C4-dicarboxylate transport system substrate-binding protein